MTLILSTTSSTVAANQENDTFDSMDSANSPAWRVENLVIGTLVTTGSSNNQSDIGYNPFSKRFGIIQNNTGLIFEYSESDIVNSVASPTLIRTISLTGLAGDDSEGVSSTYWDRFAQEYVYFVCTENGGANNVYRVPVSVTNMFGVSDYNQAVGAEYIAAASGVDNNSGSEGVDYDPVADQVISVQEGQQASTPRAVRIFDMPAIRNVDYSYTQTGLLDVTEPFDAETVLTVGVDLSSVCYHRPTGTYLFLSDTGNSVLQYTPAGVLLSTLNIVGMFQPEGITLHGDNLVLQGEVDEVIYCTYVAP
jgi:uncharacterized protein YjiK